MKLVPVTQSSSDDRTPILLNGPGATPAEFALPPPLIKFPCLASILTMNPYPYPPGDGMKIRKLSDTRLASESYPKPNGYPKEAKWNTDWLPIAFGIPIGFLLAWVGRQASNGIPLDTRKLSDIFRAPHDLS